VVSTVTADGTAPSVLSVSPTTGAQDHPAYQSIEIVFTEPIDPSSVSGTTITTTPHVSFQFQTSENTVVLIPISNLQLDTSYTASVSTGVTDLAGNPLSSPYSWTFKTGHPWQEMQEMNYPRSQHDAVAVDGQLFVFWGDPDSTSERYDPATDTWFLLPASMDYFLFRRHAAVNAQGSIYLFGGHPMDDSFDPETDSAVYRFNINQNQFSKVFDLPYPWDQMKAAYLEGNLYAIGGYASDFSCDHVRGFSLGGQPFNVASLNDSACRPVVVMIDGEIYAVTFPFIEKYNSVSNTWSVVAGNTPRVFESGAALGDVIYLFSSDLDENAAFNVRTQTWSTLTPNTNEDLSQFSATACGNHIFITGGWDFNTRIKTVLKFDPIQEPDLNR
jgi:hypothetical protein